MKDHPIQVFLLDHEGHQVERQERIFGKEEVQALPWLRERWAPHRVFVVLYCQDCRTMSGVIDEAQTSECDD
jgi:hypothetical protein